MSNMFTKEQNDFLEAKGCVVVKACPGSGKTYTVAGKWLSYITEWDKYHQGVAVLSFTNVASDEVYEKATTMDTYKVKLEYPHFIGTVDSFINEFIVLRYGHLCTADGGRPQIALADNWNIPYRWWRTECHRNGCVSNSEQFHYGIDEKFYKGNTLVVCELRGKAKALPCQQYKSILTNKNVVFQNETAYFAYKLLKKYPVIAEAIVERFPIIIIDEAQDSSEEQMAVFDLLAKVGIRSMFLVGDPDQAIYEWRNAKPECFIDKMNNKEWQTIELTGNFRSSQKICNATAHFAVSLQGKRCNNAIGEWENESEKPVLLLTNGNTEKEVIDHFLEKCRKMDIEVTSDNVAVLTRGRIHSKTDISGLWKSKELEHFACAAYEWRYGSRKKACKFTSKALFTMIFGEEIEDSLMSQKIRDFTDEMIWRDLTIDILSNMPDIELGIADWVKHFSAYYVKIVENYEFSTCNQKEVKECFKIKTRDKNVSDFKDIPIRNFFEKKNVSEYTRSSIHGVKGESYDAVLIHVKSSKGKTLTPKFLTEGNLEDELMRVAYVAMTRPRRLLMIAMPEQKKVTEYKRFSLDNWNYERI